MHIHCIAAGNRGQFFDRRTVKLILTLTLLPLFSELLAAQLISLHFIIQHALCL
jgi:hypothetical protein